MTNKTTAAERKISRLEIDMQQWRSDIETFAKTTIAALEGITAELSNGCAIERKEFGDKINTVGERELGNNKSPSSDRFSKLKSTLAARAAGGN